MQPRFIFTFLSAIQATDLINFLSEEKKFNVTLTCEKMDSKCKDVMHTFYLITRFLEKAPILKGQINVSAKYLWTLDGIPWKSTKTLGFGGPRSYLVDQVNGRYFIQVLC
ncbi:hypothetical protein DSO57_1036355 [Entomophthora muscae]|uniref:Uncharacterized protein n=1 Tax=Entomophthora muscae TaxID=34485 RepID=A0ACC2TAA5_9FUNG|nr:hypothetical protein DSO57_1036355 [Entomophthora muscae]